MAGGKIVPFVGKLKKIRDVPSSDKPVGKLTKIEDKRQEKELDKFSKEMGATIKQRVAVAKDKVLKLEQEGRFENLPVGTKLSTPLTRKNQGAPYEVIGYQLAPHKVGKGINTERLMLLVNREGEKQSLILDAVEDQISIGNYQLLQGPKKPQTTEEFVEEGMKEVDKQIGLAKKRGEDPTVDLDE